MREEEWLEAEPASISTIRAMGRSAEAARRSGARAVDRALKFLDRRRRFQLLESLRRGE
jgi:hypothetical protein